MKPGTLPCLFLIHLAVSIPLSAQYSAPLFDFDLLQTSGYSFEGMQFEFREGGLFEGYRHATADEVWAYVDYYFNEFPDPNGYQPVQAMLNDTGQLAGVISYGYSRGYVADTGIFLFGVARTTEPWWGTVDFEAPPNATDAAVTSLRAGSR